MNDEQPLDEAGRRTGALPFSLCALGYFWASLESIAVSPHDKSTASRDGD